MIIKSSVYLYILYMNIYFYDAYSLVYLFFFFAYIDHWKHCYDIQSMSLMFMFYVYFTLQINAKLSELSCRVRSQCNSIFFLSPSYQATRSSERSTARPRSPPLPAHLKNAPSVPPSRAPLQRPTRTPAPPPAKVEPPKSRAAAKPSASAVKPAPKASAKTPPSTRSSRVTQFSFDFNRPVN